MPGRFLQHKASDDWCRQYAQWTIEYAYYENIGDVEILEGHLIGEAIENGAILYNKAKTSWGKCSFINHHVDWKEYHPGDFTTANQRRSNYGILDKTYSCIRQDIWKVRRTIDELEKQLDWISEEYREDGKRTYVSWFRQNCHSFSMDIICEAFKQTNIKPLISTWDFYHDYAEYCDEHGAVCFDYDDFRYKLRDPHGIVANSCVTVSDTDKKEELVCGAILTNDPLYPKCVELSNDLRLNIIGRIWDGWDGFINPDVLHGKQDNGEEHLENM